MEHLKWNQSIRQSYKLYFTNEELEHLLMILKSRDIFGPEVAIKLATEYIDECLAYKIQCN